MLFIHKIMHKWLGRSFIDGQAVKAASLAYFPRIFMAFTLFVPCPPTQKSGFSRFTQQKHSTPFWYAVFLAGAK